MPMKPIITIYLALLIPVSVYSQDINSQLIEAATNGQIETVHALLEAGAEVDAIDEDGMTPLMWAAFGGYAETVKVLLRAGADVSVEDKQGTTARLWSANGEIRQLLRDPVSRLIEAATNGQTETVQELLEAGVDANAEGEEGVSALMYAANRGHSHTVKVLIDAGADFNEQSSHEGISILMAAVVLGDPETVQLLLDAGADVSLKDKQGKTAQMWATKNSIVALLENFQLQVNPPSLLENYQHQDNPPAYVLDLQEANKNSPLPKANKPRVRIVNNSEGRPNQFLISWEEYALPVLRYLVYMDKKSTNEAPDNQQFTLVRVTEDTETRVEFLAPSFYDRNARLSALPNTFRIVAVTPDGDSRPSDEGKGARILPRNPDDVSSETYDTPE